MTEGNTLFRRLAAGVGAIALATVGLLGATNAYAAGETTPAPVAQINPNAKGSITIHKSSATPGKPNDGNPVTPAPTPALDGVQFTIHKVGNTGGAIDLSTAEGWATAQSAYSADVTQAPWTLTQVGQGVTTNGGILTFSDLPIGLYRVTETDSGPNLIKNPAAPFLVTIPMPNADKTWNFDVHAYPKNELQTFSVTKEADDPSKEVWETGTTVDWTITANVPASALPYKSFSITESVGTGLQFDGWGEIKIGDVLLAKDTDYTVSGSTITFTTAGIAKLNVNHASAQVVTAVVNTTVLANPDELLKNDATVKLNGQEEPGSGTTNWGNILVNKTSDGSDAKLQGAVFEVYDAREGKQIGTLTDNGNGTYSAHIWVGNGDTVERNVWLKEVTAPSGHVLPADPWTEVTVKADTTTSTEVTIENHKPTGPTLPQTGSTGSLMLVLVGLGLVGASGALFAARRFRTSH